MEFHPHFFTIMPKIQSFRKFKVLENSVSLAAAAFVIAFNLSLEFYKIHFDSSEWVLNFIKFNVWFMVGLPRFWLCEKSRNDGQKRMTENSSLLVSDSKRSNPSE